MADLENGLFSGTNQKNNANDPTVNYRFLTAVVKGEPNHWSIRGGNAASGSLSTFFDGPRPKVSGYNPMHKEGAIILGIGGDNSHGAQGTFYEGAITSGYPSDATENAVQADIVAAKYATTSLITGRALATDSYVSLRAALGSKSYIVHDGSRILTRELSSSSDQQTKEKASWIVRRGLGHESCVSFESKDTAGSYILHSNHALLLREDDGTKEFAEDATFCTQEGLTGFGTHSIRSWAHPTRYIRRFNDLAYAASHGGLEEFNEPRDYHEEVSWIISDSLA